MSVAMGSTKVIRYRLGDRVDYGLLTAGKVYQLPSDP